MKIHGWHRRRPDDIDEQAIARPVRFIEGLMKERVIEDEQFVFRPILLGLADDNVSGVVDHIVQVVEDAQGRPQWSKMLCGRLPLVEYRDADGGYIFVLFMKLGDARERLDIRAVPLEKEHAAHLGRGGLLQLTDEILSARRLDQARDLALMSLRQVREPIDALVDVGQREQVQENVDRGQQPDRNPLPRKYLSKSSRVRSSLRETS